jgi:hypothetical protein
VGWRARDAGAGTRPDGFSRSKELCRQARLGSSGSMPADQAEQDILGDPVVDLPRDAERFDELRLRCGHITGQHRDLAQVHEHGLQVVEITGCPGQPYAVCRRGLGGFEISFEEGGDGSRLDQPHPRRVVINIPGHQFSFVQKPSGGGAVSGHVLSS